MNDRPSPIPLQAKRGTTRVAITPRRTWCTKGPPTMARRGATSPCSTATPARSGGFHCPLRASLRSFLLTRTGAGGRRERRTGHRSPQWPHLGAVLPEQLGRLPQVCAALREGSVLTKPSADSVTTTATHGRPRRPWPMPPGPRGSGWAWGRREGSSWRLVGSSSRRWVRALGAVLANQ